MTFVLAPDSFKESMTAKEACLAMERGIKKVFPSAKCVHIPMADGGEGTTKALVDATDGKILISKVLSPIHIDTEAEFGILGDGKTGVLEMASASGIHLVPIEKRNPLVTTSFGTGQLIKAATNQNITRLIIGIGGSASNDGGVGMAQALGIKFLDKSNQEIGFGGGELHHIQTIDLSGYILKNKNIEIVVACDVTNPLTGKNGASHVFGPQKGANKEMVSILDQNLKHLAQIIRQQLGKDIENVAGAGAAGGLGAGLMAFCDAKLSKGVDLVIKYTQLESKLANADYVFTGEGGIDNQTKFGKTPFGVSQVAKKYKIPVIAFAGKIGDVSSLYDNGFDAIFSIMQGVSSLDDALANGANNLEKTTENVVRLLKIKI